MEINQNEIQEDIARRKAILQKNRESKEALKKENLSQGPQILLIQNCDFSQFKAVSLDCSFPLNIKQKQFIYEETDEKKFDPNAINLKLDLLIQHVHGSLESKHKMIDDFNEANPECSKNSIEKKIRECFVKDKRG